MPGNPYAGEELLTFDRIKRAVTKRAVDAAEIMITAGTPLDRQKLAELTASEWKAAKEAVRTSPIAKEAAKERMRNRVHSMLDGVVDAEQKKGKKEPWE